MPLLHILLCSSLDTPPEPSPLFDVRVHASRRRTSPVVLTRPALSARSRVRFCHSPPSSRSRRAELELRPSPASPSAILAAVPRFAAPRAAQPRPLPPPPVPELVRANPGPNRPPERLRHRPPLPRRAGAPSLRRSPTSGPPPLDSRAR